jgi:hypothetical protein
MLNDKEIIETMAELIKLSICEKKTALQVFKLSQYPYRDMAQDLVNAARKDLLTYADYQKNLNSAIFGSEYHDQTI